MDCIESSERIIDLSQVKNSRSSERTPLLQVQSYFPQLTKLPGEREINLEAIEMEVVAGNPTSADGRSVLQAARNMWYGDPHAARSVEAQAFGVKDLTIVTENGSRIVNRLLFRLCSPILNEQIELQPSELHLKDLTDDVLNALCTFVTTGRIPEMGRLSNETIVAIVKAAVRYQITGLVACCSKEAQARAKPSIFSIQYWTGKSATLVSDIIKVARPDLTYPYSIHGTLEAAEKGPIPFYADDQRWELLQKDFSRWLTTSGMNQEMDDQQCAECLNGSLSTCGDDSRKLFVLLGYCIAHDASETGFAVINRLSGLDLDKSSCDWLLAIARPYLARVSSDNALCTTLMTELLAREIDALEVDARANYAQICLRNYIRTGAVEALGHCNLEELKALVNLAEMYDWKDLLRHCDYILSSKVVPDASLLVFALEHNLRSLELIWLEKFGRLAVGSIQFDINPCLKARGYEVTVTGRTKSESVTEEQARAALPLIASNIGELHYSYGGDLGDQEAEIIEAFFTDALVHLTFDNKAPARRFFGSQSSNLSDAMVSAIEQRCHNLQRVKLSEGAARDVNLINAMIRLPQLQNLSLELPDSLDLSLLESVDLSVLDPTTKVSVVLPPASVKDGSTFLDNCPSHTRFTVGTYTDLTNLVRVRPDLINIAFTLTENANDTWLFYLPDTLEHVDLSGLSHLSAVAVFELVNRCSGLKSLIWPRNSLTDEQFQVLADHPSLEKLDFGYMFQGILPAHVLNRYQLSDRVQTKVVEILERVLQEIVVEGTSDMGGMSVLEGAFEVLSGTHQSSFWGSYNLIQAFEPYLGHNYGVHSLMTSRIFTEEMETIRTMFEGLGTSGDKMFPTSVRKSGLELLSKAIRVFFTAGNPRYHISSREPRVLTAADFDEVDALLAQIQSDSEVSWEYALKQKRRDIDERYPWGLMGNKALTFYLEVTAQAQKLDREQQPQTLDPSEVV